MSEASNRDILDALDRLTEALEETFDSAELSLSGIRSDLRHLQEAIHDMIEELP